MLKWFRLPAGSTSARREEAHAFSLVAWSSFAIIVLGLAVLIVREPSLLWRRLTTLAAVAVMTAILHEMNRRGYTRAASWFLVLGFVAIFTQRAANLSGLHAQIMPFYLIFVMMGGLLLGRVGSIVTAVAAILSAIGLATAEHFQLLQAPGSFNAWGLLVIVIATVTISVVISSLTAETVRASVRRADAERAERARAETRELQLRELEQLRDDMVRMIVHDLRSPLHALIVRLDDARPHVEGAVAASIDVAMASAHSLSLMVNGVLDVSRLEEGHMPINRQASDVCAIAADAIRTLAPIDPAKSVTFAGPAVAEISCDPALVRRVLDNLVSNGIKHTPETGALVVRLSLAADRLRVTVEDSGPGIPPEARDRIFDKFVTLGTEGAKSYNSVGLGLAFCKLAIEAHGGTIGVESATPTGSVFWFEIPR